jgi:hypothetical protein
MENAFVEDVEPLPSIDDTRSDLYLVVRRQINGVTKRYIEILAPFFQVSDPDTTNVGGAWYLDCALRYQGPAVNVISGLGHLEGEVVGVFADGAMQSAKIVANASIPLDGPASDVLVGKRITYRIRDLPRDLALPTGSSRGKAKRASHIMVDVMDSAGGKVRVTHPVEGRYEAPDDTPFDDLVETGADDYNAPVKLFTGQIPVTVTSGAAREAVVDITGNDALPFTLRAITPDYLVEED